jgi:hypothetical protein
MNFDQWLDESAAERAALIEFSKIHAVNVDKAIEMSDECGKLQARAEWFLTQHIAQATLSAKADFPSLGADERKAMVKDKVKDIQFIVDAIGVTGRAIRDRIFSHRR